MTRLPTLLFASTLLSTGLGLPSLAQQATPIAPAATSAAPPVAGSATPAPVVATPAAEEAKADDARARGVAADRSAMFEAHLAALHAGLALTPDQDKLWPPVEAAVRGFATMRSDLRDRRADMRQDDADEDPIAALKVVAQDQLDHARTLKALADAADPLYAALDADQRHRLPMLMDGLVPPRGPLARMVERLDQQQHRGDSGEEPNPRRHHAWNERDGRGWDGWHEGMDQRHDDRRAEMDGGHDGWRHGWERGGHRGWQGQDETD